MAYHKKYNFRLIALGIQISSPRKTNIKQFFLELLTINHARGTSQQVTSKVKFLIVNIFCETELLFAEIKMT